MQPPPVFRPSFLCFFPLFFIHSYHMIAVALPMPAWGVLLANVVTKGVVQNGAPSMRELKRDGRQAHARAPSKQPAASGRKLTRSDAFDRRKSRKLLQVSGQGGLGGDMSTGFANPDPVPGQGGFEFGAGGNGDLVFPPGDPPVNGDIPINGVNPDMPTVPRVPGGNSPHPPLATDPPVGNIPNGDVPNGDIPNGDVPNGDVPNGDVPSNPDIPEGPEVIDVPEQPTPDVPEQPNPDVPEQPNPDQPNPDEPVPPKDPEPQPEEPGTDKPDKPDEPEKPAVNEEEDPIAGGVGFDATFITALQVGPLYSAGSCAFQGVKNIFTKPTTEKKEACAKHGTNGACDPSVESSCGTVIVPSYGLDGLVGGKDGGKDLTVPVVCVPTEGTGTTKGSKGVCRGCLAGGTSAHTSDAFKCRHDNECVSGLCIGNMYGYNEGTCAQARLPFGAACFYKESCGTEDDVDRRCVGSRFGRRGVCVFGLSANCKVSFMRA